MKRHARIIFLSVIVFLFWVAVSFRLFTLQLKDNTQFQALADIEQGFSNTIPTTRGIIKSSDGVELAINIPSYDVYVYTPNIQNLNKFERNTLPLFNFSKSDFESEMNSGIKYFRIDTNVSTSQKSVFEAEIGQSDLSTLEFSLIEQRNYPNETLLSQVLGFYNQSSSQGQYGIEGYFDGDLKGVQGTILGNKDQTGNPILNSNFNFIPPTYGEDITLTVNAHIQKLVEDKLKYWVDNQQADSGSVIIMDPKTGAIISMADYPTYDPNQYYKGFILDCANYTFIETHICKGDSNQLDQSLLQQSFNNNAISFVYEPGSVMKAITSAAVLQEGKANPDTIFDDSNGYYQANGKTIYNFNRKPDGKMKIADVLKLSSNVGASMMSDLLGSDLMYQYYKNFGIGSTTGVTLQGEDTSSLPSPSSWRHIDVATASFGQYVGATPLQVIGVYQTIANNGIRMQPYIVQSINKSGQDITTKPEVVDTPISQKTSQELTSMLTYATTGEPAWGLRYLKQYMPMIASKTGSAQVPDPNGSGYLNGVINATYVGYAPANDPKFVMLVMMKYPRAGQYAATTVVPLWADIAKDLFAIYKIPPQ